MTSTILGILAKLTGSSALAYRFIVLKQLDTAFDTVREKNPTLDQNNWAEVFDACKEDVLGHGQWWAIHRLDAFQYCLIPIYAGFDVFALFSLSFTLFGSLQVFSVIIYQFMLIYFIEDTVDYNEWISVLALTVMSVMVSLYAPTEDDIITNEHTWHEANFNTSVGSIIWLIFLSVVKMYSFQHLKIEMKRHIDLKDREKISDLFQPRPLSWYNLLGPIHLATTGALFIIIVKFVLNLTAETDQSAGIIGSILAFVFVGFGCSCLKAHSYHDMMGELHSATVFPCFVLGQSALAILSGIINFCEYPKDELGFWISYVLFIWCIFFFVLVMEFNEPQMEDQYAFDTEEEVTSKQEMTPLEKVDNETQDVEYAGTSI